MSLPFFQFIHFSGGETKSLKRRFKVQTGKSTLIILSITEECRLWRKVNNYPSFSFFIDRVFSIFPQKHVRVYAVRNWHQSCYSRTDTINNNIDKKSKGFSLRIIYYKMYHIEIKYIILMKKVQVYMCLHLKSNEFTAGKKTMLFPIPFLISIGWFLILAKAFRNDHVAACSIALCSTTEKNERSCYVSVPCPSRLTQGSSTAAWLNFNWLHEIDYDGTHTEPIFTFKIMLYNYSSNRYCKLVDTVNTDLNYCPKAIQEGRFWYKLINLVLNLATNNMIIVQ